MSRILIGIPRSRNLDTFEESLTRFKDSIRREHEVLCCNVHGRKIDENRNRIVSALFETRCDYLLFLDDDHEGHTYEMFCALMRADAGVCAMRCFSRHWPYQCTLMIKHKDKYHELIQEQGYHKCDFVGMGMTLIKREVFEKINRPYFVCSDRNDREDVYFCRKAEKKNISIAGCFDYTLSHDGITKNNYLELRSRNAVKYYMKKKKELLFDNLCNSMKYYDREKACMIRKKFDFPKMQEGARR